MINVASLVATLEVQMQGAQNTISELQKVQDELRALGNVSEQEISKFSNLADQVAISAGRVNEAQGALVDAANRIRGLGATVGEARDAFHQVQAEIQHAEEQLAAFAGGAEISGNALLRFQQIVEQGFDRQDSIGQKARAYRDLKGAIEEGVKAEAASIGIQGRARRAIESVRGAMGPAARGVNGLRLSFEQMGQVLRQLMAGRFSLSALTSLLGRFAAAMAPILAVVSPLIIAFGAFRSRIGQLGNQIESTTPNIAEMGREITALGQIDLSGLLTQLETASNRLSSFGVVDADQAAESIGRITQQIQALNATPGDANKVFQQVQQAVEAGDLSGLRDFDLDINVNEVNEKLREVREQYGQTAAQAEALGILSQVAMDRAAEGSRRASEEASTLQGVIGNLRGAWDQAVAGNEEFGESMQQLGDTLNSLIGSFEPFIETVVAGLTSLTQLSNKVIQGIRFGINSLMNWIADVMDFAISSLNNIPGVDIDVSGIEKFSEATDGAARLAVVISELQNGMADGMDAFDAFAASIGSVLAAGSIDTRGIEELQRALDVSNTDVRDAIALHLNQAEAMGRSENQVRELERAYAQYNDALESAATGNIRIERTLEDARNQARAAISEIGGASGVVGALRNLGDASRALREDANPETALRFFEAWTQGIDVALNGGAQKLEAFAQFAQEVLRPQLSDQEWEQLTRVVDGARTAFEPLAAIADDFAGASVTAADKADTAANSIGGIGAQAADATAMVRTLSAEMNAVPNVERTITVRVDQVAGSTIAVGTGGGGGFDQGAARDQFLRENANTTPSSTRATDPGAFPTIGSSRLRGGGAGRSTSSTFSDSPAASIIQGEIDRAIAAKEASEGVRAATENFSSIFGGRGGGGGGGGDSLLDVEAIKDFLQEVNRAIAIASREGVRIGTAGNAIPFEEGSFLNAEGGNLSVDTILIRGVWDFADPAAKRLIIKELQEALEALQAEV